jgi:RNA polymerase sigma-70 factor, ECF subfamily
VGFTRGESGSPSIEGYSIQIYRSLLLAVLNPRFNSPTVCRRSSRSLLKRQVVPVQNTSVQNQSAEYESAQNQDARSRENGNSGPIPVLHCLPLPGTRGKYLQFHAFDELYVSRLRSGDFRTQEHFSTYFSVLIKIKLSSRLKSPEMVEDVRQETFVRFFQALREGKILQPERLGSFVNSICNNVLLEHYRSAARNSSLDEEDEQTIPAASFNLLSALQAKETETTVREILEKLPERDRRLLREVFLEERDKDEVCRDFGVDREYLRVLLHRAKQAFKSSYLKHMGDNPPDFAPA